MVVTPDTSTDSDDEGDANPLTPEEIDLSGHTVAEQNHTTETELQSNYRKSAEINRVKRFSPTAGEDVVQSRTESEESEATTGDTSTEYGVMTTVEVEDLPDGKRVVETTTASGEGAATSDSSDSSSKTNHYISITKGSGDDPTNDENAHGFRESETIDIKPGGEVSHTTNTSSSTNIEEALVRIVDITDFVQTMIDEGTGPSTDGSSGDSGGNSGGGSEDGSGDAATDWRQATDFDSGKVITVNNAIANEDSLQTVDKSVNLRMNEPYRRLTYTGDSNFTKRKINNDSTTTVTVTYGEGGGVENRLDETTFNEWDLSTGGSYDYFKAGHSGELNYNSENKGDLTNTRFRVIVSNLDGTEGQIAEEGATIATSGVSGVRNRDGAMLDIGHKGENNDPVAPDDTQTEEKVIETIAAKSITLDFYLKASFLGDAQAQFMGADGQGGGSSGGTSGPGQQTGEPNGLKLVRKLWNESSGGGSTQVDPPDEPDDGLPFGEGPPDEVFEYFVVTINHANMDSYMYMADEIVAFVDYMDEDAEDYAFNSRLWGIATVVFGGLEIVGGIAMGTTGVGGVFGTVAIAHGFDTSVAGLQQILYGDTIATSTARVASLLIREFTGASASTAAYYGGWVDAAVGIVDVGAAAAKAGLKMTRSIAKGADTGRAAVSVTKQTHHMLDTARSMGRAGSMDEMGELAGNGRRLICKTDDGCFVAGTLVLMGNADDSLQLALQPEQQDATHLVVSADRELDQEKAATVSALGGFAKWTGVAVASVAALNLLRSGQQQRSERKKRRVPVYNSWLPNRWDLQGRVGLPSLALAGPEFYSDGGQTDAN